VDINVEIYPMKVRSPPSQVLCMFERRTGDVGAAVRLVCTESPLQANDKFAFALSSTLAEDGTPDDGAYEQVRSGSGHVVCPSLTLRSTREEAEKRCSTSSSTSCMVRHEDPSQTREL
jgi:hypothetical protein